MHNNNHHHGECRHTEHHCHCHEHSCQCNHQHTSSDKNQIVIYILSVLIFVLSFVLKRIDTILIIAATLVCGYRIFASGIKSLIKLRFNESTLILVAVVCSALLGEFREVFVITALFALGEMLEGYATQKSRARIEKLIDLTDDTAHSELGEKIDPKSIKKGDKFLLKPGDKACVDAIIESGESTFDTSNITGESIPRNLSSGDSVVSGYINLTASVVCCAVSDYDNSTASKIKKYVEASVQKKADTERFITNFASIYTPAVISVAIVMGLVFAISGITTISEAVRRSLTFMIASCPCALVISIPLAYYASLGAISKYGILVKGSKFINVMSKADAIAFDKTGTLTTGKPSVCEVICKNGFTAEAALMYAKSAEIHSLHPYAEAICRLYEGEYPEATDVKEHIGKGIEAVADGHKIVIGTGRFCEECGCTTGGLGELSMSEQSGVVLCIDSEACAVIKMSDRTKPDASEAISQLKAMGFCSIHMLSGDSEQEVTKVCEQLGDIRGIGGLLPTHKADKIKEIKNARKALIFVGDGVNDAPSLAEADFSVSIGGGSSLALESGDAVLITDRLCAIPEAIKKARYTTRVININIALSLIFKFVVLVLASTGKAPIWLALAADVGILIATVLNSLSVLKQSN